MKIRATVLGILMISNCNVVVCQRPFRDSIRSMVHSVDSDSAIIKVSNLFDEFPNSECPGSVKIEGWSKNSQLVKIIATCNTSEGIRVTEYFFTDEKLFYVHEMLHTNQWVDFGENPRIENPRVEIAADCEYYYVNGNHIHVSNCTGLHQMKMTERSKDLLIEAKRYIKFVAARR